MPYCPIINYKYDFFATKKPRFRRGFLCSIKRGSGSFYLNCRPVSAIGDSPKSSAIVVFISPDVALMIRGGYSPTISIIGVSKRGTSRIGHFRKLVAGTILERCHSRLIGRGHETPAIVVSVSDVYTCEAGIRLGCIPRF